MNMKSKIYVWIAAAGMAIIAGVRTLTKAIDALEDEGKSEAETTLKDSIREIANKSDASISEAKAALIANGLYDAMSGAGTDEELIEEQLLKPNYSNSDLAMIVAAFGVKKYNNFGKPMFDWMGGDDLNLPQWLARETGGDLYKRLKQRFTTAGFVM